jgi:hypothetical protein
MPIKRQPSDAELTALAERFRALWRQGDVLRPWLRKHHAMIRELVHDDWSWASVAEALRRARITYRTGRAWSAEGLRREVVRATIPLKRATPLPSPNSARAPAPPSEAGGPPQPKIRPATQALPRVDPNPSASGPSVPRFKPASPKPIEPPRQLTPQEIQEREAMRKRIFE